jgi:hypothetical protein
MKSPLGDNRKQLLKLSIPAEGLKIFYLASDLEILVLFGSQEMTSVNTPEVYFWSG